MRLTQPVPILALKDVSGGKTAEQAQAADVSKAAFFAKVDKIAAWLPNTSIYILAALHANLADLGQSISKHSSENDAISVSKVMHIPHPSNPTTLQPSTLFPLSLAHSPGLIQSLTSLRCKSFLV